VVVGHAGSVRQRSVLDVLSLTSPRPGADLLDLFADAQAGREVTPAERYVSVSATPELDLVRLLLASDVAATTRAADILAQIPASVPDRPPVRVPAMPSRPARGVVDLERFVASYVGEATVRGAFARGFADVTDVVSSRDHAGVCAAALVRGAVGPQMQTSGSLEGLELSLAAWRAAASGCAAWVFDVCAWFDRRDSDVASTLQWLARHPQFSAPVLLPDMSALVAGEQLRSFKLPPVVVVPAVESDRSPWVRQLADPVSALTLPPFMSLEEACSVARRPPHCWDLNYAVSVARLSGRPDVVRALIEPFHTASKKTVAAAGMLLALACAARTECVPGSPFNRNSKLPFDAKLCDGESADWSATCDRSERLPFGSRQVAGIVDLLAESDTRLRVPYLPPDGEMKVAACQVAAGMLASGVPRTAVAAAVIGVYGRTTPGDVGDTLRAAGDTVNDETVRSTIAKLVGNRRATYVTYGVYAPGLNKPRTTVRLEAFKHVPAPGVPLAEAVRAVVDIDPSVTGRQVVEVLRSRGWVTSAQYVAAPLRRYRATRSQAAVAPVPHRKATTSSRLSTATTRSGPVRALVADHEPSVV
jgi:hypothetical protein